MSDFDLHIDDSLCLLIDVQERFRAAIPAIQEGGSCLRACQTLLAGCQLLGVPILATEQYPQGLGSTLPELAEYCDGEAPAKTHFSCLDDALIKERLADSGRDCLLIAGIEAHVCVLATVDDALRHGYQVLVCADGVASRNEANRELALAAMRDLGALVLPAESLLFRLQRQAGVGHFKALSKLVR